MPTDSGVALVTGASGAIGGAVARALADDGLRVAVGYHRDEAAADALAAALPGAMTVHLDVSDAASVRAGFKQVAAGLGPVAVLVNAAGVRRDRPAIRLRDEDWHHVLRVNLDGVFHCVRQALPGMVAQRYGRIVSVGSVSGTLGLAGQSAYAAAKAGLVGFTRSVARETGRYGVTANVVAPGLVESALVADLSEEHRRRYVDLTATGRLTSADDVAAAVRFCVASAAVTAQLITVDGGFC